ncbi:predicted protein [Uncinocarpus reesii 1704]|uniref:Aminoglycoside phosphotransferase domain-containing protein n=1 Tax=Uncinocarpus reesii (strain UAMH 1704) TaxID=336963 RepID=C4JZH8_UNCRE|nr:uncharacterized protein UREG_07579 [Uncinocarpus reesii 1704]EEP82714.1 predicted protein [Uncinocarpus reesii 1704]
MESDPSDFSLAQAAIKSSDLPAIDHLTLSFFVLDAVDSDEAARYILNRLSASSDSAENVLRSIKRELAQLSRKFARHDALPLEVDEALRGELRPLLEAAITKDLTEKLFSLIQFSDKPSQLKNLWLMSPTWFAERQLPGYFVQGILQGRKGFYTPPTSPDEQLYPLPEAFLLQIHRVLSHPLHFLAIERQIHQGWPLVNDPMPLGAVARSLLRGLFALLPTVICVQLYKLVNKAVDKFDPAQKGSAIKFLPFGLVLKSSHRVSKSEANALHLVEKYTSINAPRLINATVVNDTDLRINNHPVHNYLLMTRVPGDDLSDVFYRMTYEERAQFAKDLGKCISEYRQIPSSHNTNHEICDTLGGAFRDNRMGGGLHGPFDSKIDFLNYLSPGRLAALRDELPLSALYRNNHRIVFSHSDLHRTNIKVRGGRLVGIIDWEAAGFKPEYWEYTRAVWPYFGDRRVEKEMALAFEKSYAEELEAEKLLWRRYLMF